MTEHSLSDVLSSADDRTLHEILREAENYLDAQLRASVAADQRATAVASVQAILAAALLGAAATLVSSQEPSSILIALIVGAAGAFLAAAVFGVRASGPRDFEFAGNAPRQWHDDVENGTPFARSLAEMASHYDAMISANDKQMRRNVRQLNISFLISAFSIFFGIMIGIISVVCDLI